MILVPQGGQCERCAGTGHAPSSRTTVCSACAGSGLVNGSVTMRFEQPERAISVDLVQRLARRIARDMPHVLGGRPLYRRRNFSTFPVSLPDKDFIYRRSSDRKQMVGFPTFGDNNLAELSPPVGPMPLSSPLLPPERFRIGNVGQVSPRLLGLFAGLLASSPRDAEGLPWLVTVILAASPADHLVITADGVWLTGAQQPPTRIVCFSTVD